MKVDPSKIYFDPIDKEQRNKEVKTYQQNVKYKHRSYAKIYIIGILVLLAVPAITFLIHRFRFDNSFHAAGVPDYSGEYRSSIDEDPIQIEVSGKENGAINGRSATIKYKYYYDITGVVTSVHDYFGFDLYSTYVPRDVCLAWGSLKDSLNNPDISYRQHTRQCGISWKNNVIEEADDAFRGAFRTKVSHLQMSNNHLIPSTVEVRNQIFGLKRGDHVRIVGYLVNIYSQYEGNLFSSESRTDSGNGACEIIYVTKVEKL